MGMVPAVLTSVMHEEFNTCVNYPDLLFKDGGTFWITQNSTLWMDYCGKDYFPKKTLKKKNQYNANTKLVSIWSQPTYTLEKSTFSGLHCHGNLLPWYEHEITFQQSCSTLLWASVSFGTWQRSRLWDTCQDFCGITFLFRPQKFISDFLPQVILFQVLTSLWIHYRHLSCYGQPVSAPQLP